MDPSVPRITAPTGAPSWAVLQAPPDWRSVDFISDLHLHGGEPATFNAWHNYMRTTGADAVFILGDLFEVWVGDDVIEDAVDGVAVDPGQASIFEAHCAQILEDASRRMAVYFMHGNRDFLLGPACAKACGMTLLGDPTVLDFAGHRWLLSHGDALCLKDTDYMQFRTLVRSPQWQKDFLAKPLTERQAIARALRTQSETRKRSGVTYADVDAAAACDWLNLAHASTLIHGHTHKPANHDLPSSLAPGLRRIVLSDWDAAATPPRTEVLRLSAAVPGQTTSPTMRRLSATLAA